MAATLSAAASMMECHVSVLKRAKKAGSPGFRANGSVNLTELKPWLEENLDSLDDSDSKEALECRRLLAQCEKLEFQNEVEKGNYTHNSVVADQAIRAASATKSELMRFTAEVPTWEGLSAADLEKKTKALVDSVCRNLNNHLSPLYSEK